MKHDVRSMKLAGLGKKRIEWADTQMPVLQEIRDRFSKEQPLKGITVAACLHVTSETANLCRALKAGGARVLLCASNPLSTQDDVAASLVKDYGVPTFAIKGEDNKSYYRHIHIVLDAKPNITLDDGADLVSAIHREKSALIPRLIASMEETTTGVIRLRAMEKDRALRIPVVSVNDAETKYLFDNRYGTGQSTVDGIIRATNVLFAGRCIVVAGYGWCGKGFSMRSRGLGAKVVVTEVNPIRALEATMDGFAVMPMREAAKVGDVFCTLTGDKGVIREEHFRLMKDGAIVSNSGHFNVELDLEALAKMAKRMEKSVRPGVDRYVLRSGKSVFVVGEGRLVNLACAEGHPAAVMDMSFATQALMSEYVVKHRGRMAVKVHDVPRDIEDWIAELKLRTLGIKLDRLTPEQKAYLSSWQEGT